MRVFLDTNVLVSAHVARGLCADLLRRILARQVLLVGEVVLEELRRVLHDRFRFPEAMLVQLEDDLRCEAIVPRPAAPSSLPIRDPEDRWVLASAEAGGAGLLVTGDLDLLEVAGKARLPILTPRAAWDLLGKER